MPGIENYSLNNLGLDGPGVDFINLKSFNGGSVPNVATYTNLGFTPVFAILKCIFSDRNYSININAVIARGSVNRDTTASGDNGTGYYYSSRIAVNNVVFGDDSLSFINNSTVWGGVTITIYGY